LTPITRSKLTPYERSTTMAEVKTFGQRSKLTPYERSTTMAEVKTFGQLAILATKVAV